MLELQAGLEGTAKQFYRRYHTAVVWVILSLAGMVTGITAALALMQAPVAGNSLLIGAGAVLALLAACALMRHWGLAVLTAIAPLPGLLWAAPVASGADFGAVPFLAYGLGFAAAALYSQHTLARLLQPDAVLPDTGVSRLGAGPFLPVSAAVGMIASLALLWFHGGAFADAALQASADSGLALLSVLVLLPLGISLLHFDEAFVARANRAREQRGRLLEGLAFAAVPRWGLSLTGIAVVLMVLGWYGARPLLPGAILPSTASVLLLAVVGGVIGAGWREGLALAATTGVACLLALWATALASGLPGGGVTVLQSSGLASALSLSGAWRTRQYRQHREAAAARGRVLADCGGALTAVLAGAGALLPLIAVQPGAAAALAAVVFAGLAGILLSPALATGLEAFFPRRATVEELYGPKRPHQP